MIDNRLFLSIRENLIPKLETEDATDELRHRLLDFSEKIKHIQHFCFHSNIKGLSRILGKLMTRILWMYHSSSPVMKSIYIFDTDEYKDVKSESEGNSEEYESDSDCTDSEEY